MTARTAWQPPVPRGESGEPPQASPEIGGYFGLDLPDHGDFFPGTHALQSGRSALEAAFRSAGYAKARLPAYVCDTVIAAAERAGVQVEFYPVDASLYPVDLPKRLPADTLLLYVNYFDLGRANIQRLLQHIPPQQLIIDNCQAAFAPHYDALAAVYSPRKFAGMPDGGLLRAHPTLAFEAPAQQDEGSFERMRSLLKRSSESARAGYAAFDAARRSLNDLPPQRMSHLSARLLRAIDWHEVRRRRQGHFSTMHGRLGALNGFSWTQDRAAVPLCYPFLCPGRDAQRWREELASLNIFTPLYWPDAKKRALAGSFEARFMHSTLFLPIDQRMDDTQVHQVCDRVLALAS